MKRKFREFVIDPSSDQYSASRLSLLVLILFYLPAMLVLEALGFKMGVWAHIAVIVSAVCGVYGANSAVRVLKGSGDKHSEGEK